MKLSIVVPCYNEAENIPLILKRFDDVIKRDDIEVILVDNKSKDDSLKVFERLLPKYKFAKLVKAHEMQGYGYAILSGLSSAKGEYIGWTHADMQTDPNDVIKALEIIESKEDSSKIYIKGHRKKRPIFDQFFTSGMSLYESIYLGENLNDINAQPNIFHKSFYEVWENPPQDFSLDLYALYKAKKNDLEIIRFDVIFPERVHGESSWNNGLGAKWKFIKRTVKFSRTLKKELSK